MKVEDVKNYGKDAKTLFNRYVDLNDPLHQFGLIIAVFLPTYVLTSGNNPLAGIPLYQLFALVAIIAVMWVSMNGEGELDLFGESAPVEDQGLSPDEIQVHEGG